jgi:alpha-galactosidase
MSPAVETQRLVVAAVESEDRSLLYHAMAQDPQVQARLSLDEVWRMTDELLAAEARWLPAWTQGAA